MLGPVFNAEMLRAGRRGRAHFLRWIYAGWLCLQLVYTYDATHAPQYFKGPRPAPTKAAAAFGSQFRDLVLRQQFVLIILVTPAFVAGAVTDEKTRGTLQGLLTAYITPIDIVFGKLAARCAQVAVIGLTPLPLLALVGQYAGVTPEFLLAMIAVTVLVLFGVGGTSMLASVWFRQTRSAVIATYFTFLVGWWAMDALVGAGWMPGAWVDYFGVVRVLDPLLDRDNPAEAIRRLGQATLAWGSLGVVTTMLAVWQLRPAYLRQMEARPQRMMIRGLAFRPGPVRDVVAWKECYIGRRVPAWIGIPLTAALTAAIAAYTLTAGGIATPRDSTLILWQVGGWSCLLATLMVGVRCSGSITGERERQTWDGLMTTPLTVRELVRGKHRGALRATWPYLLAAWFGVVAMTGMANSFKPLFQVAFLVGALGIGAFVMRIAPRAANWVAALLVLIASATDAGSFFLTAIAFVATWLAMYFLGAVGMACSANSNSSWRSLLATVVIGYGGGMALWCVTSMIGGVILIIGWVVWEALGRVFDQSWVVVLFPLWYLLFAVSTVGVYWWAGWSSLRMAETAVAKRDRIPPEWIRMIEFDMPRHGPSRARPRLDPKP